MPHDVHKEIIYSHTDGHMQEEISTLSIYVNKGLKGREKEVNMSNIRLQKM